MTTTEAVIFEDSFVLPELSIPEQASRVVRFDNECVLIPKSPTFSRSKLPVVLTKSYSLPLWKKKSLDSDVEDAAGASAQPQSPEENRITIKVPIPTFRRRSSRSPTPRIRSISASPTIPKSLPSCLVHRSPSELASCSVRPSPVRRPSLPIYHRRQDELTIPLRDCCAGCERITEECLKEGNDWEEKFSRGARRRRSASFEYKDSTPTLPHRRNSNPTRATEASASKDLPSRFPTTAAAFSITVDEVDKRRKSFDYSMEDTDFIRSLSPPSPSSSQLFHASASPFASSSGNSRYPRVKPRDREASSSSTVSSLSTTDELLPGSNILDPHSRLRSSPIEEEDETQLFPLPWRSRSNTPSPSPSLSPNGSSLSLLVKNTPHPSITSSKRNSCSLQGKTDLSDHPSHKVGDEPPSDTPNIPSSATQLGPLIISPNASIPNEISDRNTTPLPASPTSNSPSLIPCRPSQQKGKLSFTLPFIKAGDAIRGVGVDVLRGVTSISSGSLTV